MKVWITKYALTKGILEIEASQSQNNPDLIIHKDADFTRFYHGEGKEWHLTKKSANETANQMRNAKIKSLQAQIKKLNRLTF